MSGCSIGNDISSSTGVVASCRSCSAVNAGRTCPDCEATTTPEPPDAMTRPNSSSTSAVPYRSTRRIVCGGACDGETPAAWINRATSPRPAALRANEITDSGMVTSTSAAVASKPASAKVRAVASAASPCRSASRR